MSGHLGKTIVSADAMAWVTQKVAEIKQHPAWHPEVDEAASRKMLAGQKPYTYLLRPGRDMYHYWMSYVEVDGTVQDKPVKILLSARGWLYQNGNALIRENIKDLIPLAFHCTAEQCKPYRKEAGISMFGVSLK